MRKARSIVIILLLLLSCSALSSAKCLEGRLGLGTNWPGVQAKYCFNDFFAAELRGQFDPQISLAGARFYYLFNRVSVYFIPYIGLEYDYLFSDFIREGFELGAFVGFERFISRRFAVSLDAGLYYVDLKGSLGGISDTGLVVNMGLTYYFSLK